MKAAIFSGTRGVPSEQLSVGDVPKPVASAGHALVRVLLSPVHPSVIAGITPGVYPGPTKGGFPGNEGVGVVEELGPDCGGAPPVGTRVLLVGAIGGTYAEYVLIPAKMLIPVPPGVSDTNAAQFIVNPLTALLMLTRSLTPKAGEWVVQTAAASVLGKLVVQLSKLYGFKTINVVRSEKAVQELTALGADVVINSSTEDIRARILEVTEGKGAPYAIDAVGGDGTSAILQAMAFGGKVLVYGQLAKENISFPSGLLVVKLLTIQGFWLAAWFKTASREEQGSAMGELGQLLATGKLDCPVETVYTLDQLNEAIAAATTPGRAGKVLLRLSE